MKARGHTRMWRPGMADRSHFFPGENHNEPWLLEDDDALCASASANEAALQLGRTPDAVHSRVHVLKKRGVTDLPAWFDRHARWTPEEDAVVLEMFRRAPKQVSLQLGRTRGACQARLQKLRLMEVVA